MADKKRKLEPYLAAGEGDDEQADVSFKKRKGWEKFFSKFKSELKKKDDSKENK